MWGGVLLIVAGTWVLTQVFAGDALGRLGVTGAATAPGTVSPASSVPGLTDWLGQPQRSTDTIGPGSAGVGG